MPDAAQKVYGANPRARNLMLGAWLLFAAPLTIGGIVYDEPAMLIAAAVVSAIMLPIFWFVLRAAKLILTDSGLELHQVGVHVSTPWSNIASVRTQRKAEGLVLHEPMAGKGAERLAIASGFSYGGAPMYDEERRQLLYQQRFVPLDGFSYWLHKGDLQEAITRRAIALNSDVARTPAADGLPPAEKMSKKRVALIIVLIVACIGLGVASAISPTIMARVEPVMALAVMLGLGIYAVANMVSAANHFRARQFGWFMLLTLMALIQALLAFAALGWAIDH